MANTENKSSNVNLIDPNKIIANNNNLTNAIAQYQDMFIHVELTAERRGRSILYTTTKGEVTGGESTDEFSVNFIGVNQSGKNDPNNLNFTTNYYDGSTNSNKNDESFGIQTIKIVNNSSFIPQVDIKFVDLRGLSFFNQNDSKYRILFDFPPPIFNLTVKGYYGMALNYKLHLVKYTTEFDSNSGNFYIDAQFVALTFAPLADVLFKYIIMFGIMNDDYSLTASADSPPRNTFELIEKLKGLYLIINEQVGASDENKKLEKATTNLNSVIEIFDMLEQYDKDILFDTYTPELMFGRISSIGGDNTINKTTFRDYNESYIDGDNFNNNLDKLYIAYEIIDAKFIETTNVNDDNLLKYDNTNIDESYKKILNKYKEKLFKKINSLSIQSKFDKSSIKNADIIFNIENKIINGSTFNVYYIGIDITDFYRKLRNEKLSLNDSRIEIGSGLSKLVNDLVVKNLGMKLTIKNVFDIILDDVDNFFTTIKETAKEAEQENEKNTDRFKYLGDIDSANIKYNDKESGKTILKNKVYAFPLFIGSQSNQNINTRVRKAPIELAEKFKIPEMDLVVKFIKSFTDLIKLKEQLKSKEVKSDDGSNIWIPLSPFDSVIGNELDKKSPYFYLRNTAYGNNDVNAILTTMLNRFYAVSQNTMFDVFSKTDKVGESYVKFHADGDAINLLSSLYESKDIDLVKTQILKYIGKLDDLYTKFNDFELVNNASIKTGVDDSSILYINKIDDGFKGCNLYNKEVSVQGYGGSNKLINEFNSNVKDKKIGNIYGILRFDDDYYFEFTNENIIYISDNGYSSNEGLNVQNNVDLNSRYIKKWEYNDMYSYDTGDFAENVITNTDAKKIKVIKKINIYGSITEAWSRALLNTYFKDILNEDISIFQALIVLSTFGKTLSPFNRTLNGWIFNKPGVIQCPTLLPLYIGAILKIREDEVSNGRLVFELNKYVSGSKENVTSYNLNLCGGYIKADYNDMFNYLSETDKNMFIKIFNEFYNGAYIDIINNVKKLIDLILTKNIGGNFDQIRALIDPKYKKESIINDNTSYFEGIILPLITRTNIVNNTQQTFSTIEFNDLPKKYIPINKYNIKNKKTKKNSDLYFSTFLNKLKEKLQKKQDDLKDEEKNLSKITEDEDIITQVYYSFKNINDKWIAGTDKSISGYPFIKENKLKDYFVYVDRAMNDIGDDTVINAEILIDLFDDPNVSVYSVLSQLLSINGFNFFPLQNFMTHNDQSWKDSFKISVNVKPKTSSYFMCMYVGGVAGYNSETGNGFSNDGIISLEEPDLTDFYGKNKNENNLSNFDYSSVHAFKVKFGEQNQSIFTDIKIDSKEYIDTNESIQILSKLVGDESKTVPIPKGQNLYNLYENRSYKATINSMGNVMIQPTQYFQLENIPLFNGVYLILSVEHNITANKMMTSFSGTKIAKYPKPRVTEAIAFTNFNDFANMSGGEIMKALDLFEKFDGYITYNSMYYHKIINEG